MSSYGSRSFYGGRSSSSVLHPHYGGYQLVGDSQFLRFSEKILKCERRKSNGLAYVGFCVSGQKIKDLLERVKEGFYSVQRNVVLMIGTNDLLQNTPSIQMRLDFENLVLQFIEEGVQNLIVLTIPPVPRLAKSYGHWSRLKDYNDLIRSYHNGKDVFVVDAYSEFVKRSPLSYDSTATTHPTDRLPYAGALQITLDHDGRRNVYVTDGNDRADDDHDDYEYWCESSDAPSNAEKIDASLFEEYFSGPKKRVDKIHLNNLGLYRIQRLIDNQIEEITWNSY